MRAAIFRNTPEKNAASHKVASRFKTDTLSQDEKVDALAPINFSRLFKAMDRVRARRVFPDMGPSESPVCGSL